MGCIYLVTNQLNGRRYVGYSTTTMKRRRDGHLRSIREGSTTMFHNSIRKNGIESFVWKILFDDVDREDLGSVEMVMIRWMKSRYPNGYNLTDGGDGFRGSHSESSKRLISKRTRSGWKNPQIRSKRIAGLRRANTWSGRHHTEESKRKTSFSKLGVPVHSEEEKKRISERLALRWQQYSNEKRRSILSRFNRLGKPPSTEMKMVLSKKTKEMWKDPAYVRKQKKSRKSIDYSEILRRCWIKRRANRAMLTGPIEE